MNAPASLASSRLNTSGISSNRVTPNRKAPLKESNKRWSRILRPGKTSSRIKLRITASAGIRSSGMGVSAAAIC